MAKKNNEAELQQLKKENEELKQELEIVKLLKENRELREEIDRLKWGKYKYGTTTITYGTPETLKSWEVLC